jgi:hypothetical protein
MFVYFDVTCTRQTLCIYASRINEVTLPLRIITKFWLIYYIYTIHGSVEYGQN